jgi:hypothetical protein
MMSWVALLDAASAIVPVLLMVPASDRYVLSLILTVPLLFTTPWVIPSSVLLWSVVSMTPPPVVTRFPPRMQALVRSIRTPEPLASSVPFRLFTVLLEITSPPAPVASMVPVLVTICAPSAIVSAADWLALIVPWFTNTKGLLPPLPMFPAPRSCC